MAHFRLWFLGFGNWKSSRGIRSARNFPEPWAVIWGGAKRMGGGGNVPENALSRKFLDPSKRASGLLCRGAVPSNCSKFFVRIFVWTFAIPSLFCQSPWKSLLSIALEPILGQGIRRSTFQWKERGLYIYIYIWCTKSFARNSASKLLFLSFSPCACHLLFYDLRFPIWGSKFDPHPQPQISLLRIFCLRPGLGWKFLLRRTWSGQKRLPLQFPGLSFPY